MRFLFLVLSVLLINTGMAAPFVGWHWYNEATPTEKKEPAMMKSFQQLSASDQLKTLQKATHELQAKAVLTGKVEDIARYKRAQDMWVEKATLFTVNWERMLLSHPELDYSLRYSNENRLVPLALQHQRQREGEAIARLREHNGLLFFYRGKNPRDRYFSGFVNHFAKTHHLPLLPVSIDGRSTLIFKSNTRFDVKQQRAGALGIHYFPALVLVNPETQKHRVVSYGFRSEAELADRLLKIEDHWQAEF